MLPAYLSYLSKTGIRPLNSAKLLSELAYLNIKHAIRSKSNILMQMCSNYHTGDSVQHKSVHEPLLKTESGTQDFCLSHLGQ